MEGRDVSMTIHRLIFELEQLAGKLPNGYQSDVVAWVRVPNAGESAVLEVSEVQQGYRITNGGAIATICLDQRA
jgi:hypothetical protein